MDNLLKLAIEAHGGLERWRQFNVVRTNVSITGALWCLKGRPDVLNNVQVVAQIHRQHLATHLMAKDRRTIFTPGQVSIESESGVALKCGPGRELNLPAPFRFCNLLILQKEESAKRPTQAHPSYNYRTILLAEKWGLRKTIHSSAVVGIASFGVEDVICCIRLLLQRRPSG
jgi:hypothetical protein